LDPTWTQSLSIDDQRGSKWLELIFQAIVNDAVKRTADAAKRKRAGARIISRSSTTTIEGLLRGLASHITNSLKTPAA
jgi:hypothetical protein